MNAKGQDYKIQKVNYAITSNNTEGKKTRITV